MTVRGRQPDRKLCIYGSLIRTYAHREHCSFWCFDLLCSFLLMDCRDDKERGAPAISGAGVAGPPLTPSDAAIALPAGDVARVQGREAAITAALSAEVEKQLGVASHRFFVQVLITLSRVGVNARKFVVPQMQRRMYGSAILLSYCTQILQVCCSGDCLPGSKAMHVELLDWRSQFTEKQTSEWGWKGTTFDKLM